MLNKKTDTQDVPPRPYPRRCVECGQVAVERATIAYDAEVKHDGKLHKFHVPSLSIDQCLNCGEQYFDAETDDQISASLRQHVGLLLPEEIRQQLDQLGLKQREFAEHLCVAPESVSRWLTGTSIQSRSLDRLMRIYFSFADVRKSLQQPGEMKVPDPGALKSGTSISEKSGWTIAVEQRTAIASFPAWATGRFPSEVYERRDSFILVSSN